MLHQAYIDRCLCDCSILGWHTAFTREGCQSAKLVSHDGQPAMVRTEINVNMMAVVIREKHHSLTYKLAELLNISQMSVNQILTENLAMRRVLSVWVPHFLTNMQMNDRITACQDILGLIEDVPDFLDHIITCDKSWVHYFDLKSKKESSHWKSPSSPRKKVCQQKSVRKVHMVVFSTVEDLFISMQCPRK